jgi:hypothetical protein
MNGSDTCRDDANRSGHTGGVRGTEGYENKSR